MNYSPTARVKQVITAAYLQHSDEETVEVLTERIMDEIAKGHLKNPAPLVHRITNVIWLFFNGGETARRNAERVCVTLGLPFTMSGR